MRQQGIVYSIRPADPEAMLCPCCRKHRPTRRFPSGRKWLYVGFREKGLTDPVWWCLSCGYQEAVDGAVELYDGTVVAGSLCGS